MADKFGVSMDAPASPASSQASAKSRALSPCWAIITILKGMIGAGILNLPQTFGSVKLALAVPGFMFITALCAFSVLRLLKCNDIARARCKVTYIDVDTESEVDSEVIDEPKERYGLGPLEIVGDASFGRWLLPIVATSIVASGLGFCVAYVDVIIETLRQQSYLGQYMTTFEIRLILGAVLCMLSLIQNLDALAKLSGVALLVYCYMLFALARNGGQVLAQKQEVLDYSDWLPVGVDNMGGFIGTVLFAQEAIVIAQYVYDDMKLGSSEEFVPVLLVSFLGCGALCTCVGAIGYMAYGDTVRNLFYLNFPPGSWDLKIAEIVLCFVLIISLILQMYPVVSFFEATLLGVQRAQNDGHTVARHSDFVDDSESDGFGSLSSCVDARSILLRWSLILATIIMAAEVPNLSCVTGYSGSLAVSIIGFILPAVCHLKLTRCRGSMLDICADILLLACGVAAVYFGIMSTNCR